MTHTLRQERDRVQRDIEKIDAEISGWEERLEWLLQRRADKLDYLESLETDLAHAERAAREYTRPSGTICTTSDCRRTRQPGYRFCAECLRERRKDEPKRPRANGDRAKAVVTCRVIA